MLSTIHGSYRPMLLTSRLTVTTSLTLRDRDIATAVYEAFLATRLPKSLLQHMYGGAAVGKSKTSHLYAQRFRHLQEPIDGQIRSPNRFSPIGYS